MKICVLGSGYKPLTKDNASTFRGLHLFFAYEPTNVDLRKLPNVDIIADLSRVKWGIGTGYSIVIAEHIAEHLQDRVQFLRNVRKIMLSGGLLILEVPNWKHQDNYNTLDHRTQWGRGIFDGEYILCDLFRKVRMEYQVSFFSKTFYIKNEFIGRNIDRFTSFVTSLRFYLGAV